MKTPTKWVSVSKVGGKWARIAPEESPPQNSLPGKEAPS
jgi:hypothetical protein